MRALMIMLDAFPAETQKVKLQAVWDQFIEGVQNDYIQEKLLHKGPETMEEAVTLARRLNAAKTAQHSIRISREQSVSSISNQPDVQQQARTSSC